MDLTKSYEWEFDLEEYTMTTDVSEDYIARMKTGKTAEEEDLIKDIVLERTDIRPETLRMCNQLMADKIIQRLCEGHIVATQTATYIPSITGVFMGTSGNVDANKKPLHCEYFQFKQSAQGVDEREAYLFRLGTHDGRRPYRLGARREDEKDRRDDYAGRHD